MSEKDFKRLDEQIDYGLKIAEREMLEEKARRGENVIISDSHGQIHSVPASNYL